jgi:hypothetical protein
MQCDDPSHNIVVVNSQELYRRRRGCEPRSVSLSLAQHSVCFSVDLSPAWTIISSRACRLMRVCLRRGDWVRRGRMMAGLPGLCVHGKVEGVRGISSGTPPICFC